MDGGSLERERLVEIQKTVKLTTDSQRRERALQGLKLSRARKATENPMTTLRDSVRSTSQPIHPLSEDLSVRSDELGNYPRHNSSSPTIALPSYNPKLGSGIYEPQFVQPTETLVAQKPATVLPYRSSNSRSAADHEEASLPWVTDPQLEYILLMYYFDFVCPLQYPFYKPRQVDGGRGWILALLMRTKPMYNAALCIAAYHQKSTTPPHLLKKQPLGTGIDQERFYSLALGGLRKHIGILSRKRGTEGLQDSIDILSCVNQIIMFEVRPYIQHNSMSHN